MTTTRPATVTLERGALVPFFSLTPDENTPFVFGNMGGRFIALSFLGDSPETCLELANAFAPSLKLFDESIKAFVGLCSSGAALEAVQHLRRDTHVSFHLDPKNAVRRLYGLENKGMITLILDPALRLLHMVTNQVPADHAREVIGLITPLLRHEPVGRAASTAPVLILENVFDIDLIETVKAEYDRVGGALSGFMRTTKDGKTILAKDYHHKVRRDVLIESDILKARCRAAIQISIVPAIARAFMFEATRMERYLIGCYDAEMDNVPSGHFNRHRDNTTRGTAHRRFAVSIGLNAEDYDGGDLRFPEFDQRSYRPPTGGAVIFSCSLLHEVLPITRGRRMAFLPFLFDEAADQIRQSNLQHLASNVA
jgi:predicted 2-oxoglutarate/Fe(II)-dependent dioxygenase YbiX/peroxiredoxin